MKILEQEITKDRLIDIAEFADILAVKPKSLEMSLSRHPRKYPRPVKVECDRSKKFILSEVVVWLKELPAYEKEKRG